MEEEEQKFRLIAISAASKAIRFKEENPRATESQVIQHISDNVGEIINKVDEQK